MTRSTIISLLLLVVALPASPVAGGDWKSARSLPVSQAETPRSTGAASIEIEQVVGDLETPVVVTHAGDGSGRLFVAELPGVVRIVENGQLRPTPFLDISAKVGCCIDQGLVGLAFDPDYETNGYFYIGYATLDGDSVIARLSVSPNNPNRAVPGSEVVLKTIEQPTTIHSLGAMAFGPDGYLYVASGDGGGANDPDDRGQDLSSLLGKILRLDVDAPPDYVPVDNPFVGVPGARDEIWSYGLRNPWRLGFDRSTGDLFLGDVGQASVEEIDHQPAASGGGENWGWKVLEGSTCFSDRPAGICDDFLSGGSELPILEYEHSAGNCSVTAGYRYRGGSYPELDGIFFYADFCSGRIWGAVEETPGMWSTSELLDTSLLIVSFGEDETGEVYLGHAGIPGEIYRVVGAGGGEPIPCADIRQLQTRCPGGAETRLQARVVLTDSSHDGDTVTISIDGSPHVLTIAGGRAQLQQAGASSGPHLVLLEDPPGCFAEVEVTCP